jgi:hypothetical protein
MPRLATQILIVLAITLPLFFAWDFSQRVITGARFAETERQLDDRVARATATQAALKAMKTRLADPTFVEEAMRNDGWAREQDQVVRALITPALTPTPAPTPPPAPPSEPSALQTIWQFLFGP